MTRDRQTYLNLLALSAGAMERGVNQEQPPDTIFKVQKGDILNFGRRAWDEPVMAGGTKHSQRTYYQGGTMEGSINWNEMQPQHLALLSAYCLGDITSTANGGDGPANGYHHLIKPRANAVDIRRDVPTMTAVQRLGDAIEYRLASSLLVDSVSLSAQTDSFCKCTGNLKGTGKTQSSVMIETVAGNNGAASITLASNGVEGADAASRLASVHRAEFKLDSSEAWQPVEVQAVSGATPAVLTITPPLAAGTDAGSYKVYYMPGTASLATGTATSDPVWDAVNESCTLTDTAATMTPNAHEGRWMVMTGGTANGAMFQITGNTATVISFSGYQLYQAGVRSGDAYKICNLGWLPIESLPQVSEPYLRINDVAVVIGGHFDGASFSGGQIVGRHVQSLDWSYQASASLKFKAGDREYCSTVEVGEPQQSLKIDREMIDAVHRAMLAQSGGEFGGEAEYFGLQITGTGPEIGGGYNYGFRLTFPKLAIKTVGPADEEGKLKESMEISVKEHETHGSVIVEVWNKVATYAA